MPTKPFSQRTDAKSTKRRDAMRKVAKNIVRQVNQHSREDSWKNMITALGTSRDKRTAGIFWTDRIVDLEAEDMARGDGMAARIIESIPNQIIRAGFDLNVKTEKPDAKKKPVRDKNARLDWLRGAEGQRWWMQRVEGLQLDDTVKEMIRAKVRADLAADVFPPDREMEEGESGKDISEAMMARCEELCVLDVFGDALKMERTFGGAAIFPGVVDGVKDLTKPLDFDRVRSVDWLDTLMPLELIPYQWYDDPVGPNFGRPELYWMQRISGGMSQSVARIPIHESRLITFPGVRVSKRQEREHWSWGDSVLVRCVEALRDFSTGHGGTAVLMSEFSQGIFKMKGLVEAFSTGEDDDLLVRRATAMDEGKSIINAMMIDADEEFKRETTTVAGLADLLDRSADRLAAVAEMPVTVLMGKSPAGLNATGDADVRGWYDTIDMKRNRRVRPRLNWLLKLLFRAKDGPTKGNEPEKWTVQFGPLWQPTALEEAQRRLAVAQTDKIYIDAGVLIPEEVAISRFGGDAYSPETQLDRELRETFDERAEEEAQKMAEQMQLQAAAGAAAAGAPGAPKPGAPAPAKEPAAKEEPPKDKPAEK